MNSLNVKPQGKGPINWHFTCQLARIYENFLNNLESDSFDKNDMQKKATVLVRLHEAMQEKLKTVSHSKPIQVLTLVPDKWSRMYCSEYFNIVNIF